MLCVRVRALTKRALSLAAVAAAAVELAKNQNPSAVAALQQPLRRVVKYNEISMPFDSFCALHIPGSILMSTASSRGRAISCCRRLLHGAMQI
jgi:hypothetical protein